MPAASLQLSRSVPKVCRWGRSSCLRRVWSNHVAPGGDPERKGEPNFAYAWVHRTLGTRYPRSTSARDEPARRRRSPVPVATGPHAEPRRASAAGRSERIPSLMGRPKCRDCPISRGSNASAIARQWSIRETSLMLGWSTPTGLCIVSFCKRAPPSAVTPDASCSDAKVVARPRYIRKKVKPEGVAETLPRLVLGEKQ